MKYVFGFFAVCSAIMAAQFVVAGPVGSLPIQIFTIMIWALLYAILPIAPLIYVLARLTGQPSPFWRAVFPATALIIFLLLLGGHYYMSYQLMVVRSEFERASTGRFSTHWDRSGRGNNTEDYGGRLDRVIEKRDRLLLENGFLPGGTPLVGGWHASSADGTSYGMAYIWCRPLIRAVWK